MKGNEIFLMQNDNAYLTYGNFESNPPSTVNTAKFDCLDLSGPPCKTSSLVASSNSIEEFIGLNHFHLSLKAFQCNGIFLEEFNHTPFRGTNVWLFF